MSTDANTFVFFGATGDLSFKEIFPALFALYRKGQFCRPIIGVARSPLRQEEFEAHARASLVAHGSFEPSAFSGFARSLVYIAGDYRDTSIFDRIQDAIGASSNPLFYLAIPPTLFETVITGISRLRCGNTARLLIEKPFGRDLASARSLNNTLHRCFDEESLFRADHFLAMETVENVLYFRFANSFAASLWNHTHIKNIQITLAESFGIRGRGAFYDEVGAIRDVVQNHLFQVLCLASMEAPGKGEGAIDFNQSRHECFESIAALKQDDLVLGQFVGYHDEPGVKEESKTETYVAMRLHSSSPRWRGVPFYIRTGKCLEATYTELKILLKQPSRPTFLDGTMPKPTYFRFRLYPDMQLALGASVKLAGNTMEGKQIEMEAQHLPEAEGSAYERLLREAIIGRKTVFSDAASVESAWRIVDPILDNDFPVHRYARGSGGPREAVSILRKGDTWDDIVQQNNAERFTTHCA